jgi:hypothetical protein
MTMHVQPESRNESFAAWTRGTRGMNAIGGRASLAFEIWEGTCFPPLKLKAEEQ